jgi:hypothetical protein
MNSLDGDVPEALLFHLVCAQETEPKNSFASWICDVFQRDQLKT